MKRKHNQLLRLLTIIDTIAPLRMPFSMHNLIDRLEQKPSLHIPVCERTIRRDIDLLLSIEVIYIYRQAVKHTPTSHGQPILYKTNPAIIKNLTDVAATITPKP